LLVPFVAVEKLTLDEKNWLRSVRGDRLTRMTILAFLLVPLSFVLEVCFSGFSGSRTAYGFSFTVFLLFALFFNLLKSFYEKQNLKDFAKSIHKCKILSIKKSIRRGFITFKIETEDNINIFNNGVNMLNQQIRVEEFLLEDIKIGMYVRIQKMEHDNLNILFFGKAD